MNLDVNAPVDQLVCLSCQSRAINRHNVLCKTCQVTMVYESAWAKLKRLGVTLAGDNQGIYQEKVGQLALF